MNGDGAVVVTDEGVGLRDGAVRLDDSTVFAGGCSVRDDETRRDS